MTLTRFLGLLALTCVMTACSRPSKVEVTEATRVVLAEMLATTPETKDLGLVVGRVTLVTVEPHKVFDGMALITRGDQSRDVPIHVITDGENVMVTADNGVLALLLDPDASVAVLETEMEQAVADMDAAVAEMEEAMNESRSGRFVSTAGNAMLILPAHDGRAAAVLQLGVHAQANCVEGDVSCVALGGEIRYGIDRVVWVADLGDQQSSPCEIAMLLREDAVDLMPANVSCAGFGTANAHLSSSIADTYTFDSTISYEPSYPCAKASTAVEKTICATPVLGFLDRSMGELYRQHVAASADVPASRRDQLAWVAERDRCADASCLMNTYLDRLYRLQ